jgi:hypothetical protein
VAVQAGHARAAQAQVPAREQQHARLAAAARPARRRGSGLGVRRLEAAQLHCTSSASPSPSTGPRPRRVTGGGSARACSGAPRASSRSAEREPPTNRAFQFRLQYEKVDSTSSRSRLRTSRFMMASISAPWRRPWPASRWWTVASHPRRALLIAP